MVAGCGITCIKYTIFFFNFLFFVLGLVAAVLGIYILVDRESIEILSRVETALENFDAEGLLLSGAVLVTVVGCCLLVLGFLGCCGALRESRLLLGLYCGIVIVIVIVQIVAAGLAIALKEKISDHLQTSLKDTLTLTYETTMDPSNPVSMAFDLAQVHFGCCGVVSADDFKETVWYNTTTDSKMTVPGTCCKTQENDKMKLEDPQCPMKEPSKDNPNTATPCYNKIKDWIFDKAGIVIGIAVGIIVVEVVAIIMACCLFTAIEN